MTDSITAEEQLALTRSNNLLEYYVHLVQIQKDCIDKLNYRILSLESVNGGIARIKEELKTNDRFSY